MHFCLRPSSFYRDTEFISRSLKCIFSQRVRAGAKDFAERNKQITARRIQRHIRPSERMHKQRDLYRAMHRQKQLDNSLSKHCDATSNRRVTRSSAVKKGLIDLCRDDWELLRCRASWGVLCLVSDDWIVWRRVKLYCGNMTLPVLWEYLVWR